MVVNMFQLELLVFFTFGMKINATDATRDLIKANIVKPFKTGTRNGAHAVVWHQKILLPPHENVFPLHGVFVAGVWALRLLLERSPGRKPSPVLHINLFIRSPFCMPCLKCIFCADYFALKVRCESGMIVSEPLDPQIAAEKGLLHVNMLYLHLDVVYLTIRLLCPYKARSRLKKG